MTGEEHHRSGDMVLVGLAYRGGGLFEPDGYEGTWYVVHAAHPHYKLAKHPNDSYAVIIHAARLTTHPTGATQ